MRYQVFIDRARDASPTGLERTAQALARRYGFPPEVVLDRLRGGRFSAWNDLDLPTARSCATELEGFGLVCSVIEEGTGRAARTSSPPLPARATRTSQPPPMPAYATGLGAASAGAAAQDLGALGGAEGWQIASLDGVDEATATAIDPAAPPRPGGSGVGGSQWAVADPFAPPPSEREVELEVPLATPAPSAPPSYGPPPHAPHGPSLAAGQAPARFVPPGAADAPVTSLPPAASGLADALAMLGAGRLHTAAGVLLALMLGFLPAHVVGCAREAAYDDIRAGVTAEIAQIDSPESWDSAAATRAEAQSKLASRKTNIAVSSAVVWALAFTALLYAWFRVIDWDDLRWRADRHAAPPGRRA